MLIGSKLQKNFCRSWILLNLLLSYPSLGVFPYPPPPPRSGLFPRVEAIATVFSVFTEVILGESVYNAHNWQIVCSFKELTAYGSNSSEQSSPVSFHKQLIPAAQRSSSCEWIIHLSVGLRVATKGKDLQPFNNFFILTAYKYSNSATHVSNRCGVNYRLPWCEIVFENSRGAEVYQQFRVSNFGIFYLHVKLNI